MPLPSKELLNEASHQILFGLEDDEISSKVDLNAKKEVCHFLKTENEVFLRQKRDRKSEKMTLQRAIPTQKN